MANIFISHASADEKYISPFVNIILKQALGLRDEEITFTSSENTGIMPGMNIPAYIFEKIPVADVFLVMCSPNHTSSAICQKEIGAAMGLKKKILQILVPGTKFSELPCSQMILWGFSINYLFQMMINGMVLMKRTAV